MERAKLEEEKKKRRMKKTSLLQLTSVKIDPEYLDLVFFVSIRFGMSDIAYLVHLQVVCHMRMLIHNTKTVCEFISIFISFYLYKRKKKEKKIIK